MQTTKEAIEQITKALTDEGFIIEAGWQSLRLMTLGPDASERQLDDLRNAFFAGAQHIFFSIMTMLEPGEEGTDNDLRRLSQINNELERFLADFSKKHGLD